MQIFLGLKSLMPWHIELINKMISDFNIQDLTLKKGYFSGSFLLMNQQLTKAMQQGRILKISNSMEGYNPKVTSSGIDI